MGTPQGYRYFLTLFCLLCLYGPLKGEEKETVPTDSHEKAAYFMRTGKSDQAIALYRALAAKEPANAERQKELMWALWQANRTKETVEVATRLTHLVPQDIEVLNLLGRAQVTLGQRQPAMFTYEKSLSINPDQLSVRLAVVRLHIDLKDYDTASKKLAVLKDRYPQEPTIYADQAQIAFYKGSFEEAKPLWAKAVSLAPDNLLYKVHEAETLYHLGQMPAAHEILKKVVTESKGAWPAKERREIWALLETIPGIPGEKTEPLLPSEHPFGVDEVQIGLALGRLYSDLRDYDASTEILLDLAKTHKDNPEIYNRLAKQYFLREMYREAAKAWERASRLSPDDVTFIFEQARSLYYAGDRKTARTKLQDVAARQSNSKWRAIDFLTDVALVNKDLAMAQDYLEGSLSDLHRPDEPRYLRLASIYLQRGEIRKSLATIDHFISANPLDGRALMFKGGVLTQQGRGAEAVEVYKKVLELNPGAVRAYFSLADIYYGMGIPHEALAQIEKARVLDPTDPNLLIWQARYLYDVGDVIGSKRLLRNFLETTPNTVVPSVLYHGLSALDQDPLLAYSVHFSQEAFDDHMRAFKAAGYTPITAKQMNSWIHGQSELPTKPILITFDDDLLSAFRLGDPILEKYKLKATMFIPLVNVDRNLPGYASWDQLAAYQKNGRWELQSHGDIAHIRIVVDPEGRNGLYLLSPQWLATENRYETKEEWIQRIAADHISARRKMDVHLGVVPVAYAYPEGDFGQMGLPSAPEAAAVNQTEIRKAFGTSYHQDVYGVNVRTRDPHLLTRLEPDKSMSGNDLVHWFAEKNPFAFARMTLLRQAIWQGNIHEAFKWLDEIENDPDVHPRTILTEEAHIYHAARDLVHAQKLAEEASTFGDTPDLDRLKSSIETAKRYIWNPEFIYQEDNRNRTNWVFHQTLSSWGWGNARWTLHHARGSYRETGSTDVTQNTAGVASAIRLGLFHTLDGRLLGQFLSGQSNQTTYTASGGLRSQWTDRWSTEIEGGRSLYETATALNAGIAERYARAAATWVQDGPWQVSAKGKIGDLSDGNDRYTGHAELTRRMIPETDFRLGYHFETDHMRRISPDYYSPQHLIVHQAVVSLTTPVPPGFYFNVRYLPGYGKEEGISGGFINDLEIALQVPLGKQTMLTPEVWLSRTPTYHRDSYSVSLTHRF